MHINSRAWIEAKEVFSSPTCTLAFLEQFSTLILIPQGRVDDADFQEVHMQTIAAQSEYQATRIIIDETRLTHISNKSRMWLTTNYIRLPEVKNRVMMMEEIWIVKSKNVFAATLTRVMQSMIGKVMGIRFRYFQTVDRAIASLEEAVALQH